ncbi:MAG TPA: sulfatase-like hydrolase/transferase [Verrucomicrobiota bacterium]|nr:sulfatase-like hydrolase/transferase [Verrucomicrobiota bacterium]
MGWLGLFILWLPAMAVFPAGAAETLSSQKPNFVLMVSDDMGYADLGVQGGRDIPTPNLDALARGGVRFTQAYVSAPLCSPMRAGLMTGVYPQRFGHEFNCESYEWGMSREHPTIAERLKPLGYRTALVGKWHLGFAEPHRPLARGFDEFYGWLNYARPFYPDRPAGRKENEWMRNNEIVVEKEYQTDAIAREAVDFIRRSQKEPFFLYVAFGAVHDPIQPRRDTLDNLGGIPDPKRRAMAGMLVPLDEAVGRIVGALRQHGLERHTLVVFINDNGADPGWASSNGNLRGFKRSTYEGGIRVPFFMAWPGRLAAGTVFDRPVIQLDIHPTLAAAAGLNPGPTWKLDGVNLWPFLDGRNAGRPHQTLYWRIDQRMAIRDGDWKLVRTADYAPGTRPRMRTYAADLSDAELYDLAKDPDEKHDLARDPVHAQRVAALKAQWQAWSRELREPFPGPK